MMEEESEAGGSQTFLGGDGDVGGEIERREEGQVARDLAGNKARY